MARFGIALLVALALSPLVASQDTTGTELEAAPGFKFGSSVGGYLQVSEDACDIKELMDGDKPNYAEAKKIYTNGANSKKSDGSIRTIRSWATTSFAGEPFYDMYAAYFARQNVSDFLDGPISRSLDGGSDGKGQAPWITDGQRAEQIEKGVILNLPFVYMRHELDEGREKLVKGQTDAKEGAAHNVDEVFAIYVGNKPACTMFGQADKRAYEFGLTCDKSQVNTQVTAALQQAQAAGMSGNLASYDAAVAEFERLMIIPMLQNVIKYSQLAEEAVVNAAGQNSAVDAKAAPSSPALQGSAQAEGHASARTIAPILFEKCNRSHDTVLEVLYPGNAVQVGDAARVKKAVQDCLPALGITAAEIGTYNPEAQKTACGAKTPTSVQNSVSSHLPATGMIMLGAAVAAMM